VGVICRELEGEVGDFRLLSLNLAGNLIISWNKAGNPEDDTLCDCALQLLRGLLEKICIDKSEEFVAKRLALSFALLRAAPFRNGELKALALSLDLTTPLLFLVADGKTQVSKDYAKTVLDFFDLG